MADANKVDGPDLTQDVALSRLDEGVPFLGTVDGDAVVVIKKNDRLFAIGARCTHYGGPLEKGLVVGETIRCPWHHARFDLNTGDAVGAPAFRSTGCYPVEVDGFHFRVLPKSAAKEAAPVEDAPDSVVIVGAGAAAAAVAETLRQEGFQGSITMVGAENSGPVDRPNLSKDFLAGDAQEDWIPLGGDEHWKKLNVDVVAGDPVTSIDRKGRSIETKSGAVFSYDRLVYATGAEPNVPPMGGLDSTRYFTLRSFDDSQAIVEAAEGSQSALVVGASFIGLEVAASLRARGLDVTVAAPESLPLARILGDELGQLVKSVHEKNGVQFELGAKVENFDGGTARLSNSEEISFDFVVLGVGVQPRTDLASAAGLDVDDGVIVDVDLRTSDESIYAAGDVARYPDPISGEPVRIEHWVVAERQGQAVARNILSTENAGTYADVPFFWSRHFDLNIQYVGYAKNFDEVAVNGSIAERDATVGYLKGGKVLAVATLGRSLDALRAEWAIAEGDQKRLLELVGK